MFMARGNNCTVGNENDLLGLLFGGLVGGGVGNSDKKVGL
jgi:hypothetical protein